MKYIKMLAIVLLLAGAVTCLVITPENLAVLIVIAMFLIAVLKNESWEIYPFLVIWSAFVLFILVPLMPGNMSILAVYTGSSLAVLLR